MDIQEHEIDELLRETSRLVCKLKKLKSRYQEPTAVPTSPYKTEPSTAMKFIDSNLELTGSPDDVIVFKDFYDKFRHDLTLSGYKHIPDIRKTGILVRKIVNSEQIKKKRYPVGSHTKLCLIGYKWRKQ